VASLSLGGGCEGNFTKSVSDCQHQNGASRDILVLAISGEHRDGAFCQRRSGDTIMVDTLHRFGDIGVMNLRSYLQKSNQSGAEFSRKIGVSTEAVRRYQDGTRIPGRVVMAAIVKVSDGDVQPNDFFAPISADDSTKSTPTPQPATAP
jgi:hypothetical protein